ncbi:hypothetical protein CDD81_4774 [Ophiocordyceps australis]|uniref:HMA domain-containing protein n=1 Tax=Ophiocordyceps australis TaxID=1399860 RepID=A0A2C5YA05_9HYPO|nr:hypothetical protein CDD81_4774 [Ophiocordyceps australis]
MAQRLVTGTAGRGNTHKTESNGGSTCSAHLSRAFEQYSAYLESARRICQKVLRRAWPSRRCDDKPGQAARLDGAEMSRTVDQDPIQHDHHHHHHHHHGGIKCHATGEPPTLNAMKPLAQLKSATSKKTGCCSTAHAREPKDAHAGWAMMDGSTRTDEVDLEKAKGQEWIVLSVTGMTCSGCANKMERTLCSFAGVSSVRVNFVMSSAEFRLDDSSAASLQHIIRGVEKATGFGCTRVSTREQSIDVLASGDSAKALTKLPLPGVTQVTVISNKIVRIGYDARVVGARELVQRISSLSCGLAPPGDDASIWRGRRRLHDQLVLTMIAGAFTLPIVIMAWSDNLVDRYTQGCVCLVFATIVQLVAVPVFYRPAVAALVHSGSLEMDMLIVISITAAYTYSVVAFGFLMVGKSVGMESFFETSSLLITLVLLGRLMAAFARMRAVEAVSLRSLQSNKAIIVQGGREQEIDARLLQYGDVVRVEPHSTVPTDGIVTEGWSEVDESMLTGESVPVTKQRDDTVIAGTVNGSGVLTARLTRLPGNNTVADIAQLVEEAANSKPRLQDIADGIAAWFVPVVSCMAVIVLVVWMVVGVRVRGYSGGRAVSVAITYAVATLAVSCPCALGLAVPMVLVVAGGMAARKGVIIKSAECTERARKVTDVVFDKTGTITEGELQVTHEELLGPDEEAIVGVARCLAAGNKHPVSLAVAKHLQQRRGPRVRLSDMQVVPGAGVEAVHGSDVFRAGSPSWTATADHGLIVRLQAMGRTLLVVTRNGEPVAVFALLTRVRAEAAGVVHRLVQSGIRVHLVSGDQMGAVMTVAAQVGIFNVAAQCTPSDKRDYVASLMATPRRPRIVMFVGDGTNDAVAVTQADVGVQLASVVSASHVTRGAADVVLLNGLEGVVLLLRISAIAFRRMLFNFVWSAAYNVLALLFASGALVNVRIPPAYAGLGEMFSVLPVIGAAVTMLFQRIRTNDGAGLCT